MKKMSTKDYGARTRANKISMDQKFLDHPNDLTHQAHLS